MFIQKRVFECSKAVLLSYGRNGTVLDPVHAGCQHTEYLSPIVLRMTKVAGVDKVVLTSFGLARVEYSASVTTFAFCVFFCSRDPFRSLRSDERWKTYRSK
jgi:hypothetical protein